MASCLHPRFKRAEGIIAGRIRLLTDLILFDLAYVVKLVSDGVATVINHMDGHVGLGVVAAQRGIGVHHLRHGLALLVLQLEAHVIWICAKLALEELLALGDAPVEIETKLGEERAVHTSVRRI